MFAPDAVLGIDLILDPWGPTVAPDTPVLVIRHKNPTPLALTCYSRGSDNITWDIPPVLNFGELENPLVGLANSPYSKYCFERSSLKKL